MSELMISTLPITVIVLLGWATDAVRLGKVPQRTPRTISESMMMDPASVEGGAGRP